VTNGKSLLTQADGRGVWARRFRDVLHEQIQDLGGEANTLQDRALSRVEHSLRASRDSHTLEQPFQRAAALVVELEKQEVRFALAPETEVNDAAIYLYQAKEKCRRGTPAASASPAPSRRCN
jgi:hypothetical protein